MSTSWDSPGTFSGRRGNSPTTTRTTMPREMILAARTDPALFVQLVLQDPGTAYRPMAAVHRDLQRHLTEHPRALVELPRDHGKTTQVCLRVLWELGRCPELRVKIVCASEAVALDRSRYLRRMIVDPRVRAVFPHLTPGRPWCAAAFAVQRRPGILGPSVAAFGVGACSTGTRADLLVCDDIVDVKAVYSQAERDRVAEDFFNNLANLLEPDGRFWSLSTPWHADDLNAKLKRNGQYALFRKPVSVNLNPVWPQRWNRPRLAQRSAEIGSAAFARGYLLTPIATEELLIRPEWVQTWSEKPASFERIILSVDPAVSLKPGADATAIVVLGKAGNEVYCLSADARRLTAPALVSWLEALDISWRPGEIVFESNGAFDAVRELLVKHAQFGPKVVGVKQSRSKLARFAAFAVPVQNGSFRLCGDGSQRNLYAEMTQFPFARHDDLLDAAATGMSYLLQRQREPRVWDFWETKAA